MWASSVRKSDTSELNLNINLYWWNITQLRTAWWQACPGLVYQQQGRSGPSSVTLTLPYNPRQEQAFSKINFFYKFPHAVVLYPVALLSLTCTREISNTKKALYVLCQCFLRICSTEFFNFKGSEKTVQCVIREGSGTRFSLPFLKKNKKNLYRLSNISPVQVLTTLPFSSLPTNFSAKLLTNPMSTYRIWPHKKQQIED